MEKQSPEGALASKESIPGRPARLPPCHAGKHALSHEHLHTLLVDLDHKTPAPEPCDTQVHPHPCSYTLTYPCTHAHRETWPQPVHFSPLAGECLLPFFSSVPSWPPELLSVPDPPRSLARAVSQAPGAPWRPTGNCLPVQLQCGSLGLPTGGTLAWALRSVQVTLPVLRPPPCWTWQMCPLTRVLPRDWPPHLRGGETETRKWAEAAWSTPCPTPCLI